MLNEREQLALLNAVKYAPINTYKGEYYFTHKEWRFKIGDYCYHQGHICFLLDKYHNHKTDWWNSKITLTLKDIETSLGVLSC